MKKRVSCDSSSLILLYKSELIELFLEEYEVMISETVLEEISRYGYSGSQFFGESVMKGEIEVVKVGNVTGHYGSMDSGEITAIEILKEDLCDFILADDGKAARYCRERSIPYINALLVLRIFFLKETIGEEVYTEKLTWFRENARYSDFVLTWVEGAGKEDLNLFFC